MGTLDDVPGWSGMWLETAEVGYLEISDSDPRMHRPPAGWTLATVDECVEHSSQIFRYVRTDLVLSRPVAWMIDHRMGGLIVAVAAGASIVAHPFISRILTREGVS